MPNFSAEREEQSFSDSPTDVSPFFGHLWVVQELGRLRSVVVLPKGVTQGLEGPRDAHRVRAQVYEAAVIESKSKTFVLVSIFQLIRRT